MHLSREQREKPINNDRKKMSIAKWSKWRRTIAVKAAASLKTLILNLTQWKRGRVQRGRESASDTEICVSKTTLLTYGK